MHPIRALKPSCQWILSKINLLTPVFIFILCFERGLVPVSSGLDYSNAFIETSPTSGLCENKNISCAFQLDLFNVTEDDCIMFFHRNVSQVCASANILKGNPDHEEEYGKMTLTSYLYKKEDSVPYTGLNVSFSDYRWERVYMRFIENQVPEPSLCREFQVRPENTTPLLFFFDCLWELNYESKFYHFEYQAFTPSGEFFVYKYIFFVPNSRRIDVTKVDVTEWQMFMAVDVTGIPNRLVLRLQVAPKSLGITGYKVEVLRTLQEDTWVVHNHSFMTRDNDTEIRFVFDTKLKFGKYKFQATPIHPSCLKNNKCITSSTPEILIVEMTEPKLLTGIVVTVILIPILLMAYFIWKRNCDKDPTNEPAGPPKFLFMYKPVSIGHMKIIMELYRYFTKVCHVHTLLDQFGIPESETKDPVRWYVESFREADFVGIFASPETSQEDKEAVHRFNRYLNTEAIARNQLNMNLCSPGARCKFFTIILPGTKWETLPTEAQALKRYTLPRDLDPLLVLIGVTPQCDGGVGFVEALTKAAIPDTPCLNLQPPPIKNVHQISKDDSTTEDQQISLCCNTQSASDLDLVSSRQYLSDMSTASSIDHLSLLELCFDKVMESRYQNRD